MNLLELQRALDQAGMVVRADAGELVIRPKDRLTPDLITALKEHKPALLSLLEPARSPDAGCPAHWQHLPLLPAKGERVSTEDNAGGLRYRVALFGRWFIVRFCPNVSPTHLEVVGGDGLRRAFADLHELYRWAWAEQYAGALTFRAVN